MYQPGIVFLIEASALFLCYDLLSYIEDIFEGFSVTLGKGVAKMPRDF